MTAFSVAYFIPFLFCFSLAHEDAFTTQYNTETFSTEIQKKHHFVMFYAPWCGHCERLAPTWDELAEMLSEDSNVRIAKVDCTTDSKICTEQDVTGYPTLKFYKVGESEGVKFRGTRDLPTLINFISEQLRTTGDAAEADIIQAPMSGLKELTEENFEQETEQGKMFVKFYAPWCGHCQKLAPVWEELAKAMEFNEEIGIGKIDCTQHRSVCNEYDVKGYPTLLWLEHGKKIDRYQGERNLENLKQYVNKMAGTVTATVEEKPTEDGPSPVTDLTGDDFVEGTEKGYTFIKFFAPWCGYCKRLAPTWEDLGKRFESETEVTIAKVDCTLDVNKQLCNDQEIEGFPSLYLYKGGSKISQYKGSRSLEDLVEFVKSHLAEHDEL